MADTTVNVTEQPGMFVLTVSYSGGPARLLATVATGDQAAYPEAVARNRAEAIAKVDTFIARYPNAVVLREATA